MLLDSLELYLEFGRTETSSYHQVTTCLRRLASYFMAQAQDSPSTSWYFLRCKLENSCPIFCISSCFFKRGTSKNGRLLYLLHKFRVHQTLFLASKKCHTCATAWPKMLDGVSERNYFDFSAVLFGFNGSLNKDLHRLQSLKFNETQMWTKFLFR